MNPVSMIFVLLLSLVYSVKDIFRKKSKEEAFNRFARIDLIVGKTGSGKSLQAVRMIKRMKKQMPDLLIYSNIHVKGVDVRPLSAELFEVPTQRRMVVIDEAQATFPANSKGSNLTREQRRYLTQNRKGAGTYLLCLTQDYSMLDINFRKLCHYVYQVERYFNPRFCCVRRFEQKDYQDNFEVGGVNTFDPKKRRIRRVSSYYVQTDALRNSYDYKQDVDTDWI